jgi:hypothetical protein
MALKMFGGGKIPSQAVTPIVEVAPRPDMGQSGSNTPAGLKNKMPEPSGTFHFGHSGGAPTVASGGENPNPPLVGETNLHTGSGLMPTRPKNVSMTPNSVK